MFTNLIRLPRPLALAALTLAMSGALSAQSVTCGNLVGIVNNTSDRYYVAVIDAPQAIGHDDYITTAGACDLRLTGRRLDGSPVNLPTRSKLNFLASSFGSLLKDAWVAGRLNSRYQWVTEDRGQLICGGAIPWAPKEPNGDEYFIGFSKSYAGLLADKGQGGQGGMKRFLVEFKY